MNKKFNDWYVDVCLSPLEGQIEKRIKCIEEFADNIKIEDILSLVKLYYGMQIEEVQRDYIAAVFSKIDATFSARYSEELALLAGCVLLEIAENNPDYDSLVEQLVLSICFCGEPIATPEIKQAIQEQYDKDRIYLRESSVEREWGEKENTVKDLENHIDENGWDDDADSKLLTVLQRLTAKVNHLQEGLTELQETQSIYREDSQLLWWMLSKWSNVLNCDLETIGKTEGCLMVGYEAASLITNDPGPYSIEGVLKQMVNACLGEDSPVAISDLIMNTNQKFKDRIIAEMKNSPLIEYLPLCNAIIRADNTEAIAEWYPKFKRECIKRNADINLRPSQYALQMYMECMAQHCYTKNGQMRN